MEKKKTVYTLFLLFLPTLVATLVFMASIRWRIPTEIKVDITVDRANFTVGGTERKAIVGSIGFQSITFKQFDHLKLTPKKVELADPAQYIFKEDKYPESAWIPLKVASQLDITGVYKLQSEITIQHATSGKNNISGKLDSLWVRPGTEITLDMVDVKEISSGPTIPVKIKISKEQSSGYVSFSGPFELIITNCHINGITKPPFKINPSNQLTYRIHPLKHIAGEITSQPNSFTLILSLVSEKLKGLFNDGIIVTALDFTKLDESTGTGEPLSSVIKGEITYAKYPEIEKVTLEYNNFFGLEQLKDFHIERLSLAPESKGINLHLRGTAGYVKTAPLICSYKKCKPDQIKDHRLRLFDLFWYNKPVRYLFIIIGWVFPTTIGLYKLYHEIKGG
jgi:hypothetical protein